MFLLNTTMLREKFTLNDASGGEEPMIAAGNRITLPLLSRKGQREERLIVRGQNMHTTLRMAALICRTYFREGPIQSRKTPFDWAEQWANTVPDFERQTNQSSWIAVYSAGRTIFKEGTYHPFMDIIEQCDARNRDEYDRSVEIAEKAFNMAGRGVTIAHDTTIAMVIGAMDERTRVGLMFRHPRKSATFNFVVEPKAGATLDMAVAEPHHCLLHAAAWLELIQLSVNAGFTRAKGGTQLNKRRLLEAAQRRIGKLNAELEQFEETYDVFYRPERPNMLTLIDEVEKFAQG